MCLQVSRNTKLYALTHKYIMETQNLVEHRLEMIKESQIYHKKVLESYYKMVNDFFKCSDVLEKLFLDIKQTNNSTLSTQETQLLQKMDASLIIMAVKCRKFKEQYDVFSQLITELAYCIDSNYKKNKNYK